MIAARTAQNAHFSVDTIALSSATNTITSAIAGVTITLRSAQSGVETSIGSTRPTAQIEQAVSDFVDATTS